MSNLRRLLASREVVALLATAFTADVISGIVFPSFSLYAQSLGASLALIGALTATGGITQMLAAVPVGMLADKRGHRNVILAGMALFAISSFLYTVVPNPYLLLGVRILAGVASVSVFFVGLAYLGDVTSSAGARTGGGSVDHNSGHRLHRGTGHRRRGGGRLRLPRQLPDGGDHRTGGLRWPAPGPEAGRRDLRAAAAPRRRARKLGQRHRPPAHPAGRYPGQPGGPDGLRHRASASSRSTPCRSPWGRRQCGAIFSLRAFASAASRLPTGLLTARIPSQYLLLASLVVDMAAMLALSWTATPLVLAALVAVEGLAYGVLLTAGQACVTEHSPEGERATVVGFYSGAGSIGSAAGSLAMGVVAQVWGLPTVFRATGVLVGLGIAVLLWAALRRQE